LAPPSYSYVIFPSVVSPSVVRTEGETTDGKITYEYDGGAKVFGVIYDNQSIGFAPFDPKQSVSTRFHLSDGLVGKVVKYVKKQKTVPVEVQTEY
jgi:hypothetical protein